ncbi:hypothetical protein M406DRAFT_73853 [Cryphonectria parasitica EP155]|uniref:Uncharacterized protein n=1 Tax=Cryphonectria parasitica (strain ATCC 38755 / EP155) TaxID=660469 RepID=A0A9P4XYG0_CRYP1|nr:uncharacterized protein M406DRAFT_73853 [Cryphonectria parasitica EP155]KAF3763231.1 hypothetical protein M406DRAFT_73853 [Cryphonectria parasitica EP155]
MAACERQDTRAAYPTSNSIYAEGVLAPDVLVLTGQVITSETALELPLYILSHPVTTAPPLKPSGTDYIILTRTSAPPQPLFHLTRQCRQPVTSFMPSPTITTAERMPPPPLPASHPSLPPPPTSYYLTSLSASLLGNIHLETPPPQQQQTPPPSSSSSSSSSFPLSTSLSRPPACLSALLHPGRTATDVNPEHSDPNPVFFAWMRMRWLSRDEYNYLDATGRQVACEEVIAGDGPATWRLVVTRALPRALRDSLVAMWCLRVWMGVCEGWEVGGGGGGGGGGGSASGEREQQQQQRMKPGLVPRADVTLAYRYQR